MSDRYRPTSRRQRLIIVAVTAATVVALWMLLIYRPGWHVRKFPDNAQPCAKGQTTGCVGGKADVMLIPATPASAPASGSK
ncbi:MAG TPA: hypothetical protein VFY73_24365 [Ideonella sp.]|uniref:hypothetical protein n=1 Tax=Ideonella sp. TaxID=1929293 RepID=UPI002E37A4D9|nr:hypothetical protein [Ideonella sp.]HEX5687162.1 hypothetical protein [Ideonella sp.]